MRDYEIAEYQSLRQEILESDKTCILLMQYLILLTAATVGLLINNVDLREYIPLFGAILSSIWILGFLYISEKRYVIKRAAFYIYRQFEYNNNRFGW